MGLDAVELVMEVEERFNVTLPDAECWRVRTVADLAALVLSRLPRASGVCPTARAFFALRREIVASAGVERRLIRPTTRLDTVFASGLRGHWRRMRAANPRLPRLVASPAVDQAFLWTTAIVVLACVPLVGVTWGRYGAGSGAAAFAVAAGAIVLVAWASTAAGWRPPPGLETVGDMARAIAPIEPAGATPGARLIAQQQVLEEVRRITSKQLGVPLEQVRAESEFVRDLRLG